MRDSIFIGTSGWSYPWTTFYPKRFSSKEKLIHYAEKFTTTEVNYSFYHLPKPQTYEDWYTCTPKDFIFSVKLSRFITHIKRLKDIEESVRVFLQNASVLKEKLGPILVQLPPNFKLDIERLAEFLQIVKMVTDELNQSHLRFACEFRHEEWFIDSEERHRALSILKENNVAFVFGHSNKYPYPADEPVTADFVYLRFHGPSELFYSEYSEAMLHGWVPKIKQWHTNKLKTYAYFNNTAAEYAVQDAFKLKELLSVR